MMQKEESMEHSFKYINLYKTVRKDIVDGRYRYQEKMPSKRLLSGAMGVSVLTVEHCYALLEEEGYIEGRERSGYYVIYRDGLLFPIEEKQDTLRYLPHTPSENREGMGFSIIAKTFRKVLSKYGEEILVPSEQQGKLFLRTALKEYLRRARGIFVTEEQIVIGSGAEQLYTLLSQILKEEGEFAVENPSYERMQKIYRANGIRLALLEMGKKGIHSAALQRAESKVLHVTPFHSYPSGITAPASKRREYLEYARKRDGFIIEDDYDSEFSALGKPEDSLFAMDTRDRVYYLNSFSKTIGPAFRMAYLLLPKTRAEADSRKISFYSCSVPVLEQCLLTELLQSGEFERHINRIKRKRRSHVTSGDTK